MKKMRKLMSLLLALSVVLGCSVNAFAALPEEEEVYEPRQLVPVMMDAPPMGTDGEYTTYDRFGSGSGTTNIGYAVRNLTPIILAMKLGTDASGAAFIMEVANVLYAMIDDYMYDPNAYIASLYYDQIRYSSPYPGCYKVERYYYTDPQRTIPLDEDGEPVVYYLMYV